MKMKAVSFWVILFLTFLFTACSTEKTDDEVNLNEDELKRMFANTNGF